MVEQLRKGEEKFIRKIETLHKERSELAALERHEEKVRFTLEEIKREIEELPEIKREEEFHHSMPISQMTNVLAQAIDMALNNGVEEALKFIYKFNNPYLVDAFHDLLVGHFVDLLMRK
jgi:response regulator RpfG family c-di-GMP phosphodiesterase